MSYDRNGGAARTRTAAIREIPDRRMSLSEIVSEKWPVDFVEAWRNRLRMGAMGMSGGPPGPNSARRCWNGLQRDAGGSRMTEMMVAEAQRHTAEYAARAAIALYGDRHVPCGLIYRLDDLREALLEPPGPNDPPGFADEARAEIDAILARHGVRAE